MRRIAEATADKAKKIDTRDPGTFITLLDYPVTNPLI
jgi:hypothetical protein